GAAATSSRSVRALDLECRPAERFHEIDSAARHEIEADRIDHQFHAFRFADHIVGLRTVTEVKLVLEARASAAFYREAQNGRPPLLAGNSIDAGRRGFGEHQTLRHASNVGRGGCGLKPS